MPVQHLHGLAIDEADVVRSNANDGSILPVDIEYVIMPGATKVSDGYPKLAERCEERARNIAVWMEKDVVCDLRQKEG
jgi:hypothetical protein